MSLCLISERCLALTTGTISGKAINERTGEALPGANVFLKGTQLGAATAADGTYIITKVPPGSYEIVASFVGFRTQSSEIRVVVGETAEVNFSLMEDVFRFEEMVVTGIASSTSRSVAPVSVSRLDATDYTEKNTYQTVSQLFNGKIPGVVVKPASDK